MKKIFIAISSLLVVFSLTACSDLCIGAECVTGESGNGGAQVDGVLSFTHINGEGVQVERPLYVLFEYEARDFVKYQISYLSCTCRNANVNYWQIAYVEIDKADGTLQTISYGQDGEDGHYTAGMWGDSSPTPEGHVLADFESDYIPWLIGKSLDDLDGISVFTNDNYHGVVQNEKQIDETDLIDDFAGSSVSTNNMIRSMKRLLEYHAENY